MPSYPKRVDSGTRAAGEVPDCSLRSLPGSIPPTELPSQAPVLGGKDRDSHKCALSPSSCIGCKLLSSGRVTKNPGPCFYSESSIADECWVVRSLGDCFVWPVGVLEVCAQPPSAPLPTLLASQGGPLHPCLVHSSVRHLSHLSLTHRPAAY